VAGLTAHCCEGLGASIAHNAAIHQLLRRLAVILMAVADEAAGKFTYLEVESLLKQPKREAAFDE